MLITRLIFTMALSLLMGAFAYTQQLWIEETLGYDDVTQSWLPVERIQYTYEGGEQVKTKTWYSCEFGDSTLTLVQRETYDYLPEGKLLRTTGENPGDNGALQRTYQWDYFYYDDGGMAKEERRTFREGVADRLEVTHFDAASGQKDAVLYFSFGEDGMPNLRQRSLFTHEGRLTTEEVYILQNGEWVIGGRREQEVDEFGNLIRAWTNISDYMQEEAFLFAYDDYGNQVLSSYLVDPGGPEPGLRPSYQITTAYEYEGGRIQTAIRNSTFYHLHNGAVESESQLEDQYAYFCDGVLKSIHNFDVSGNLIGQTRYYYLNGTECDPLKRSSFEVRAYPNPTSGLLILESDGLFLKDSEVQVYDSSGRLMKSLTARNRIDYLELNLTNLPSGVYFLSLRSGAESSTVRVVKD